MTKEETYSKGWIFERDMPYKKEIDRERNVKASLFWLPVLFKCP